MIMRDIALDANFDRPVISFANKGSTGKAASYLLESVVN
jgi:hypothetical protein